MRRISIDILGLTSSRSRATFEVASKRPWHYKRYPPFIILLFLVVLWVWLHRSTEYVTLPEDSFQYLEDKSLNDILNSTLGFQKIFVLNLPDRTDRRDAMTLSAALTNIKLEYINGVTGESINQKAYPPPDENIKLLPGIRGSWRTHMKALQRIVEQNLTTAFILEDDVDWDIRVRQNLQRFALASRFLAETNHKLTTRSEMKSHIEERPNTETESTAFQIIDTTRVPTTLPTIALSSALSASGHFGEDKNKCLASPYGDPSQWDILWLGHCGAGMPRIVSNHSTSAQPSSYTPPNLVLTTPTDATVPLPRYLKAHPFQSDLDALATAFPPQTRIYHRSTGGQLCTVGYAVSQRGARRLLHQFGVKGWNNIFDAELGRWCAGYDPDMGSAYPKNGDRLHAGKERVCLTTQPPIFAHHHPMKGESDIGGLGGGYARKYETKYLRYSVRMNLEGLVDGMGERELSDQWPDEDEDVNKKIS
ncbi:hypothetical protein ACN47E_005114 [Coniothyrium glycines]